MDRLRAKINREREKRHNVAPGSLRIRIDNVEKLRVGQDRSARSLECVPHAGLVELVGTAGGEDVVLAAHVLIYRDTPKAETVRIEGPWDSDGRIVFDFVYDDDAVRASISYEGTIRPVAIPTPADIRRDQHEDPEIDLVKALESSEPAVYQHACGEVFRRYFTKLKVFFERRCGPSADAEQLALDVLQRALTQPFGFIGLSTFAGWIFAIARRTVFAEAKYAYREGRRRVEEKDVSDEVLPKNRTSE